MLRETILSQLCYTELVYQRINKKLQQNQTKLQIENLMVESIINAESIIRSGKNYYVYSPLNNIRITINANNYRVITADQLKREPPKKN